jgi:hypothetical protein
MEMYILLFHRVLAWPRLQTLIGPYLLRCLERDGPLAILGFY